MNELFRTQYGSRLYGTNTPTSDVDWKVIYLPDLKDLLMGKKLMTISQSTGDDKSKNTNEDEDVSFVPLHTFARDFFGGQTYAIEVAFALLSMPNRECDVFTAFVEGLTSQFLTSNVKAMVGYAYNQAQIYGVKGSRLASIEKFYDVLANEVTLRSGEERLTIMLPWVENNSDKYLFTTTYENHDEHLPAISLVEKIYPANITIGEALSRTKGLISKYGVRANAAKEAGGNDWKALSHAVRITMMAIDLLEAHKLKFPLSVIAVDYLLNIKSGNVPFDEVQDKLVLLMEKLDIAQEKTTLPAHSDELDGMFDAWLFSWLKLFYGDQMYRVCMDTAI